MIIGEERPENVNDKILASEVVLEKSLDGKESLEITVKVLGPGVQACFFLQKVSRPTAQARPVRLDFPTGQTDQP